MCYLIDFPTFSTLVENFLSHQKCMHIWIIRTSFSKFYRNKISHYIIIRLPVHFVQPIKYSSSRRQVPLRRYWYLLSTVHQYFRKMTETEKLLKLQRMKGMLWLMHIEKHQIMLLNHLIHQHTSIRLLASVKETFQNNALFYFIDHLAKDKQQTHHHQKQK